MNGFNRRVLVVDDEHSVREGMREILGPGRPASAALLAAETELFGEAVSPAPSSAVFDFEVDTAATGMESFLLVRGALARHRPFALAFLDVRMPGWDGVETARRLRELDPKLGIIFITAFSDRSVEEIIERVGSDVGYHCKPFQPAEIRQIATKGVHDWNRMRSLEEMIALAAELRAGLQREDQLLERVARLASQKLRAGSIAVHRGSEVPIRLGRFEDDAVLAELRSCLPAAPLDGPHFREDDVSLGLAGYTLTADLPRNAIDRSERFFLLRLLVEEAARALEALELRARVLRQEKLAILGQSMSKVVHDLRQPLTIQKGLLDLLAQLPEDANLIKEALAPLQETVEDLDEYLSDLADFAGEPRLRLEPCRIEDALSEALRRLRHRDGRGVITVEAEPGVRARLDPARFRRVLLNLIINALEAVASVPEGAIGVQVSARGSAAVIRISDNGPGVPPELRERLFDPFVTAGKSHGTGLGLAIARQIMEAHEGGIELRASSADGASFELWLPLYR